MCSFFVSCLSVFEFCITKCAITAYVCLNLVLRNMLSLPTCVWILYDKMCYCCLRVLNLVRQNILLLPTCVCILYDKMCYYCLRVLNLVWQNVLLLSTCAESCMTKCAITAYLYPNLSGRKNFRCRVRHLRDGIHNVRKRISGYFTAFTLSSFQNDTAPTFVTDVSIFSRTKCRLNKQVTDFWGSMFSCWRPTTLSLLRCDFKSTSESAKLKTLKRCFLSFCSFLQ